MLYISFIMYHNYNGNIRVQLENDYRNRLTTNDKKDMKNHEYYLFIEKDQVFI